MASAYQDLQSFQKKDKLAFSRTKDKPYADISSRAEVKILA